MRERALLYMAIENRPHIAQNRIKINQSSAQDKHKQEN
jgi:hypothetical protein